MKFNISAIQLRDTTYLLLLRGSEKAETVLASLKVQAELSLKDLHNIYLIYYLLCS